MGGLIKMKKYIVEVVKAHTISFHLQALQVNGSDIPNTERDIIINRTCGIYLFKTAKTSKEFVNYGNSHCAGGYIYKGIQP